MSERPCRLSEWEGAWHPPYLELVPSCAVQVRCEATYAGLHDTWRKEISMRARRNTEPECGGPMQLALYDHHRTYRVLHCTVRHTTRLGGLIHSFTPMRHKTWQKDKRIRQVSIRSLAPMSPNRRGARPGTSQLRFAVGGGRGRNY